MVYEERVDTVTIPWVVRERIITRLMFAEARVLALEGAIRRLQRDAAVEPEETT